MLLKRQIISWLTIVVFFTSTTGFSIYEHICNVKDIKAISLYELLCLDTSQIDDCCSDDSTVSLQDDCCDNEVSFNKYIPTGKTETQDLSLTAPVFALSEKHNNWLELTPLQSTGVEHSLSTAPDPHIHQPKSVSERLSGIQSYLC